MQTRAAAGAQRLERLIRVAPPLALLVLLVLAALLLGAKSAHATTQSPPPTIPLAIEEENEGEEEFDELEAEEEACEEAEEELEEGELGEADVEAICEGAAGNGQSRGTASRSAAPDRCPLRSAHARAVTVTGGRRLKLTVGYTTTEPTGVTVEISSGTTRIGSFRRHLGRSGVLRIVRRLDGRPAPRRLVVRLRVAGSPRQCSSEQTQRIRIRRQAH